MSAMTLTKRSSRPLQAQRELWRQWSCSGGELPNPAGLEAGTAIPSGMVEDSVIARTEVIEQQSEEDWPAWLADHHEPRHHGAWDEATGKLLRHAQAAPAHGPEATERSRARPLACGHGRPMAAGFSALEGASMTFVSGEHLSVHYPETTPGEGASPASRI